MVPARGTTYRMGDCGLTGGRRGAAPAEGACFRFGAGVLGDRLGQLAPCASATMRSIARLVSLADALRAGPRRRGASRR